MKPFFLLLSILLILSGCTLDRNIQTSYPQTTSSPPELSRSTTPIAIEENAKPEQKPLVSASDSFACLLTSDWGKYNKDIGIYKLDFYQIPDKSFLVYDPTPKLKRGIASSHIRDKSTMQIRTNIEEYFDVKDVEMVKEKTRNLYINDLSATEEVKSKDYTVLIYSSKINKKRGEVHIVTSGNTIGLFQLYDLENAKDGKEIMNLLKQKICE